ncbi:hypothetical protein AB0J38_12050 [Streptomyces sp. NPDC050095]|uniref:hypothetical protein n=1 Tax=unclassified Streptomyces TaxID=2593676 RepID=UPI00344928E0
MAQDSWPSPAHNSRAVTDTEYEKIAARASDDGVYGMPADTQVVSAGTGLSVNVRAGVYATVRGHAWSSGSAGDNLPIAANSSGSTRIDRVVLRLDRSAWTVRAAVRQGTPGSAAPTLVQQSGDTGLWEILLANVTVQSGASTVTVARNEVYVGARCRPCLSTTRNPNPVPGEFAYEMNTQRVLMWTGATWSAISEYSDVISCDSPLSAWAITVETTLEARNGTVFLRLGTWDRKGSSLGNTTDSRLPVLIPDEYRHPNRNVYAMCYITGAELGRITIYPKSSDRPGQVWINQKPTISVGDSVLPESVSWVVG